MREAIEGNFRARHPDLLDDPLLELPDNLRRFLVGLDPLASPFGASEVSERFRVTARTARTWLKAWREREFIEPQVPGAKRVHKFRLSPRWLERLDSGSQTD